MQLHSPNAASQTSIMVSPRRRSSSKTQQNYHPINATPLDAFTDNDGINDMDTSVKNDKNLNLNLNLNLPNKSLMIITDTDKIFPNNDNQNGKNKNNKNDNKIISDNNLNEKDDLIDNIATPTGTIQDQNHFLNNVENSLDTDNKKIQSNNTGATEVKRNNVKDKSISEKNFKSLHSSAIQASSTSGLNLSTNTSTNTSANTNPNSKSNKSTILHKQNSDSSKASIPSLKKSVHVVRLISPDQPDEYLKVLSIPLYPDTLKIGRQNTPKTSNKITDGFFDSRVLSRNHAELFIKENQLFIRDLKSSNGTFLNDDKLIPYKDYKLSINDKIDLGTTLESQMAHKKITCIIKEFDYITLKNFESLVEEINSKDEMISKKMELFNNTFDALLFGEIVDDIVLGIDNNNEINDDLLSLIAIDDNEIDDYKKYNENITNKKGIDKNKNTKNKNEEDLSEVNSKFVTGLDLKPSQNSKDVVKKLINAVNNEYIQQQRLKQMNTFLYNYNNVIAGRESNTIFKIYDKLLKREKNHQFHHQKRDSSDINLKENQYEMKYLKSNEKLKNAINELDLLRNHLINSKERDNELKKTMKENEELKKFLEIQKMNKSEMDEKNDIICRELDDKNELVKQLREEIESLEKEKTYKEEKKFTNEELKEIVVNHEEARDMKEHKINNLTIVNKQFPYLILDKLSKGLSGKVTIVGIGLGVAALYYLNGWTNLKENVSMMILGK